MTPSKGAAETVRMRGVEGDRSSHSKAWSGSVSVTSAGAEEKLQKTRQDAPWKARRKAKCRSESKPGAEALQ